jgi:2-methylcitrate dehydratase PrpD
MDGHQLVAKYIKETTRQDIPEDAKKKATLALLDAIGAAISGTMAEISTISLKFAAKAMHGDEAAALVFGTKLTAAGAAFVNANSANAFDSDDDNPVVKGHIGSQLIPTALAVAQKCNRSGRDLITAIAIGYEVAFRIAAAWHRHHDVWRAGGSWGSVSNTATAAKLMGLSEAQIYHSIGIAEYHAPLIPIERDLSNPAMVKHGMGWGAANAIMAAELAELGYTGIPSILSFDEYKEIVFDIGKNYMIAPVLGFKEFPAIAYSHLPRYCIRKIRENNPFNAEDVEKVLIESFRDAAVLPQKVPTTTENAQFNVTWAAACELLFEDYCPRHQLKSAFDDEKIVDMNNRIDVVEIKRYTELYDLMETLDPKGSFGAKVIITLRNGKTLAAEHLQRSFGKKLTEKQLVKKFNWLVESVYSKQKSEKIADLILNVENLESVGELISAIV